MEADAGVSVSAKDFPAKNSSKTRTQIVGLVPQQSKTLCPSN